MKARERGLDLFRLVEDVNPRTLSGIVRGVTPAVGAFLHVPER